MRLGQHERVTDYHWTRPAPWAVGCAWLVPLTILPSAIWRLTLLSDEAHQLSGDGWYLVLLSVVSMAAGLLTLGLVHQWGVVFPRWFPVAGGRRVPARAATAVAVAGGVIIILLELWGALHEHLGVDRGPVLIGEERPSAPAPGGIVGVLYAPMTLWGPLVILVALDYRRRTKENSPVRQHSGAP